MARAGIRILDLVSDDDLIEINPTSTARLRGNRSDLPNPVQSASPAQRRVDRQRSSRLESARRPMPWDDPPAPAANNQRAPFIDLTGEPDSPEGRRNSQSQGLGRNPRRTGSQRASPPRLARSDSTIMSLGTSFIDLTADSPGDNGEAALLRQAGPQHRHHRQRRDLRDVGYLPPGFVGQILEMDVNGLMISHVGQGAPQIIEVPGSNVLRNYFYPQQLNIAGAFGRGDLSPKPPVQELLPTRDGYTRDTSSGSEGDGPMVMICPACREELAYDPTDPGGHGASGSGSKKRKKAAGEHHFWALKKCGHVYCADCFENRRPTKASPNGVGFPCPDGKTPASTPADLRCAVENCETKVAAKTEWIGIFL